MPTFKPLPIAVITAAVVVVAAVGYSSWSPEPAGTAAGQPGAGGVAATGAGGQYQSSGTNGVPGVSSAAITVNDAMGTTLDAARLFELGFAGGLVIDQGTRSAIEAVLNSMPENPSEDDLKRLERTLREGLPREDAEKALKLFSSYRGYTADVHKQLEPLGIPGNVQEMNAFFDQMDTIKRRHFDESTNSALFGQHDAYARTSMEAMFVEQDTSLTPEQKLKRLQELRAKLPPDQQSLIPLPTAGGASQPAS
ncbi:MAG: lipase secretion chaperone [Rhizobacter sp.]